MRIIKQFGIIRSCFRYAFKKYLFLLILSLIFCKGVQAISLIHNYPNNHLNNEYDYKSPPSPINEVAYVLFWDKAKFLTWYHNNMNNKIIFRFYYYDDNTNKDLTIAGWTSSSSDYFDDDPSINDPTAVNPDLEIIKIQSTDNLDLSAKKYFLLGNIKLSEWMLNRIKRGLKTYRYILLKPVLDFDNHVIYEIYLQNEDPHSVVQPMNKTVSPNAILIGKADPSPPASKQ